MSRGPVRSLLLVLLASLAVPAAAAAAEPLVTHVDTPAEVQVDLATQVRASRMDAVRAPSADTSALPTTWCGGERTSDDTADSTLTSGQAYYKLVYAYAADEPDRFAQFQDVLQADVSLIGQYMALQDGATKAPRFDMGTSCGPQYVDVQVVRLPGARATYADQFDAIAAGVSSQLGPATGPRDVVIVADGLTANPPSQLYGTGQFWGGADAELPGASNPHNAGGLAAALFVPVGYDPAVVPGDQFYPGFWPEGMLHEMTHTLGAVMADAPHATSYGHCTDGHDVMCYADGGSAAAPYTTTACPLLANAQGGMNQTYDCGGDDYFNPDPAPGSYLANHWNTFNSVFEAPCSTLGNACGSGAGASTQAPPAAAPAPSPDATAASAPAASPSTRVLRRANVALLRGRRIVLRVGVTSRTIADRQVAHVSRRRVHLARHGRYRLTLCAGGVCVSRTLHARHGRARVPALVAATHRPGPVKVTLRGPGGRATGILT
jgi:hypothetical protein